MNAIISKKKRTLPNGEGGKLFSYKAWKDSLSGEVWLPSGATRGCYPHGMLELSEILILVKTPAM